MRLSLPALAFGFASGCAAASAAAADFALDASHTSVHFAALHRGVSYVRGRVPKVAGTVRFDPAAKTGAVDVRIDAASLDTGNRLLDEILRGDQYLDTARYGEVRYASERFLFDGDRLAGIEGTLVLHGVARPLRLDARHFVCKDVQFGLVARHVCGGEFRATLRRSDFGMSQFLADVGDDVELTIEVEATRQ